MRLCASGGLSRLRVLSFFSLHVRYYSVDPYSQLWSSLEISQPESTPLRFRALIEGDLDEKSEQKLQSTIRKALRSYKERKLLFEELRPQHTVNALAIWRAGLIACIPHHMRSLKEVHSTLFRKLGEPPAPAIAGLIGAHLTTKDKSHELFKFLDKVPDHIVRDILEKHLLAWSRIAAESTSVDELLMYLALRGVFPQSNATTMTLRYNIRDPVAYMRNVTAFLSHSPNTGALSSRLCAILLRMLPAKLGDEDLSALKSFLKHLDDSKPLKGKRHALNATVWTEIYDRFGNLQVELKHSRRAQQIALALRKNTVDECYRSIFVARIQMPRTISRLYSKLLFCCARDSPHDLHHYWKLALEDCNQTLGKIGQNGRKRVLLSGIVRGLVSTENWGLLAEYVGDIKATRTEYLWNEGVMSLAKTRNSEAWNMALEMQKKKLAPSAPVIKQLLLISVSDLTVLLERIETVLSWNCILSQRTIAELIYHLASGHCNYRYKELLFFYERLFDVLAEHQNEVFRKEASLSDNNVPVISGQVAAAIAWTALVKHPTKPWNIMELFATMKKKNLISNKAVSDGVVKTLRTCQNHKSGEAVRIRRQCPIPIDDLVTKFNNTWHDNQGMRSTSGKKLLYL